MTDLEITILCAEAMELLVPEPWRITHRDDHILIWQGEISGDLTYQPLKDLRQAMSLLLSFDILVYGNYVSLHYPSHARSAIPGVESVGTEIFGDRQNIPRAICTLVARMQQQVRAMRRRDASS